MEPLEHAIVREAFDVEADVARQHADVFYRLHYVVYLVCGELY